MIKTVLIFLGLMSLASAEYLRNDNVAIVHDTRTNLTWQDDQHVGGKAWEEAIDYCEALTLGDHDDWRLPNYNELNSIIDNTTNAPAMNPVFESTVSEAHDNYWSSTTYADVTTQAWTIQTRNGWAHKKDKTDTQYLFVRCVREQ